MGNITKQKRNHMIDFLEEIKNEDNNDLCLKELNEIENQLKDKKFGLVFEEHIEEVDEILKNKIPVFCSDKERRICKDDNLPWNFLIEGDNLQSLYLLQKTHYGKIDCIYIDPPYNTGAKDWKYNNDYVDKQDAYRHSKWLSMMNTRMILAKKLLKSDGVFICAIDENELATILLLIEDVFGLSYKSDVITVVHNPRGIQGDNFSYVNEYAIFTYKKGMKVISTKDISVEEIDWQPLRNWGDESERLDAANCFYPILVKDGKIVGFGEDVTNDDTIHPAKNEYNNTTDTYYVYPIDAEGVERKWRYARQSVDNIIDLLRVKESNGVYDIEIGKDYIPYKTVWADKKFDANQYGTQLIKSMVPSTDFSFPKSLYNVYECIHAVTKNKPNAIILDYFAGSGTTGHATILANKLLGGNRKFILCTNNDVGIKKEKEFKQKYGEINRSSTEWKQWQEKNGIATSVTYPRLKAAIEGFSHKKDYKETLFEKKLTVTRLKKYNKIIDSINDIKENNEDKYNQIKTFIEDNTVKVVGIIKKEETIQGINANIKYFHCDWIERYPKDYLLSNALCLHIKEMIELQNSINIDQIKNVLILNKQDFNTYILNPTHYKNILNLWVNQNIILNTEQTLLLEKKGFKYIPKEFFAEELREVAE